MYKVIFNDGDIELLVAIEMESEEDTQEAVFRGYRGIKSGTGEINGKITFRWCMVHLAGSSPVAIYRIQNSGRREMQRAESRQQNN